ncbi:hypothetical protein IW150_005898 [Coemansia sp. RSA 2607]|nr:hypothetical protein IW150_005898 [Coemansia sp. RSA 2607]
MVKYVDDVVETGDEVAEVVIADEGDPKSGGRLDLILDEAVVVVDLDTVSVVSERSDKSENMSSSEFSFVDNDEEDVLESVLVDVVVYMRDFDLDSDDELLSNSVMIDISEVYVWLVF